VGKELLGWGSVRGNFALVLQFALFRISNSLGKPHCCAERGSMINFRSHRPHWASEESWPLRTLAEFAGSGCGGLNGWFRRPTNLSQAKRGKTLIVGRGTSHATMQVQDITPRDKITLRIRENLVLIQPAKQ
jgi:hypothetical protein